MTDYYKYPRTPHLHFSGGATTDDRTYSREEGLATPLAQCGEIVVTEKMDGEATSIYRDHTHARSIDSRHHPSRNWVKQLQGQIGHLIPEQWKVAGENLYAVHTVEYRDLPSYFMVYSIWDENRVALSWDRTVEWTQLLGLHHVPVLYRGPFDLDVLEALADDLDPLTQEGFVVRTASGFPHNEFDQHVAKYVTAHFKAELAESDEHWMHTEVVPNQLKDD